MNKATQRQLIRDYIDKHGSITNRQAYTELMINSPTARISEMVKNGEPLCKETIYYTKEDGTPSHYMRYSWESESL